MIKIGNYIINEQAIAYVNLNSKKSGVSRDIEGVRIHFIVPNHIDYVSGNCGTIPDYLFFSGKEAEAFRKYYEALLATDLNTLL